MADNQEFQEEMTAAEAEQAFGNVTDAQAIEQYTRYHQYEEATRKMAVAERRKLREKTEARRIQVAKLPLDVDPYDSRTWTSKYRHTCETILEYDQKINTLRRQMDGHFLESGGYRNLQSKLSATMGRGLARKNELIEKRPTEEETVLIKIELIDDDMGPIKSLQSSTLPETPNRRYSHPDLRNTRTRLGDTASGEARSGNPVPEARDGRSKRTSLSKVVRLKGREEQKSPYCIFDDCPGKRWELSIMAKFGRALAIIWLCVAQITNAIDVDFDSTDSIKHAAGQIAYTMMTYYKGNQSGQIPGLLPIVPEHYFWWECGAMMGSLISYWHYTGDTTYNDVVSQALQFQVGPYNDYMPPNESSSLGNDDQAFWGMAALAAAEYNFPDPLPTQPSWLSLAQAVFNEQIGRWETRTCGGGIRWQIYEITGYNLKNTISNGCLFNIASRLARYTGDQMYADWAVKVWDWMSAIQLFDDYWNVYDNADADKDNCSTIDPHQWTYNAATLLMGASTMYNYTNGSDIWRNRTSGLLGRISTAFFVDGVMQEICEESGVCDTDQKSFKAYLSRWMAAATQMAPFTYENVTSLLTSSAKAATAQCNGGSSGQDCGIRWYNNGTWDGTNGVGQQMSALEVTLGTLIQQVAAPVTNSTGGTSIGNPSAGFNISSIPPGAIVTPPKHKDKVGAWFLTALILVMMVATTVFMWSSAWESTSTPAPPIPPGDEKGMVAAAAAAVSGKLRKGKEREHVSEGNVKTEVSTGALQGINEVDEQTTLKEMAPQTET
ncbi:hypothetical protein B7494_g1336 [Chlorociboria aeruginascens]|nr:hypothetical protein B7494_g1336 [Chlorociboria aeruginascens]